MARLIANSYGKSAVRLTKVLRKGAVHSVFEMEVAVLLEGAFQDVYTKGDNSACVPTDTMKNTVFALGKKYDFGSVEEFAGILCEHFVGNFAQVSAATVAIEQTLWERIGAPAKSHAHAFVKSAAGKRTAHVRRERGGGGFVKGGITALEVMKTTRSGFEGFLKDELTTLKETKERIFGTSVEAMWEFAVGQTDFDAAFEAARGAILNVFAEHDSRGVQQTLYAMGEEVLRRVPGVMRVDFVMPNQHRLLVNLEPFGMGNENEIFVATSEPFGVIRGGVARD